MDKGRRRLRPADWFKPIPGPVRSSIFHPCRSFPLFLLDNFLNRFLELSSGEYVPFEDARTGFDKLHLEYAPGQILVDLNALLNRH